MKQIAPYRFFFPLGVLSSLIGVGIWLFQDFAIISPVAVHSRMMMGGFLWSFITGFLMTALPKMSKTKAANPFEVGVGLLLVLLQIILSWQTNNLLYFAASATLIVFIMIFAITRLLKMNNKLPVFFSHIGLGLAAALAGCCFYFIGQTSLGLLFYFVAPVLLLVLGIGTRFFSFLSGLPVEFEVSGHRFLRLSFHLSALGILLFLYLAGVGFNPAYLALALLSTFYMLMIWKIQRPSSRPSTLKYAVRTVAAAIPLSFFLIWIQPVFIITWLHLLFVGCFALLTYSVATRVTLAHGSYSLDLETRSKPLLLFFVCLCLALIFRIVYGLNFSASKPILLNIAVALWLSAVLIWSYSFLPKMLFEGPESKALC